MILSDKRILEMMEQGRIVITPFNRDQLGSSSYDVRLGNKIAIYDGQVLDSKAHNSVSVADMVIGEPFTLWPSIFYLMSTIEYTETHGLVPFLEGKSSTGRLGIDIHATAGKGDPGFCGHWTLEVSVKQPVVVYPGMPIGQLIYFNLDGEVITPYNQKESAKYKSQGSTPVESMMWKNKF